MTDFVLVAVAIAFTVLALIGILYAMLRLADWQDTQEDYDHDERGR